MSAVNSKGMKWQQVAGIGMICGLAVAGCSRSDKTETTDAAEQPAIDNSTVAPAVNCDNPLVQDRLKIALKNLVNQQGQRLAVSYANEAEVSFNGGEISSKVNGIVIDIQNAAVLQEANANGMTTCQASVSMTLPSEDLYEASQMDAANNQSSLQTRLAQDNIRINNNMLIDDAFTYVAGAQGGQVRVRIAGQPALITIVADIMAGSVLKSAIDSQRVQAPLEEQPRRREPVQSSSQNQQPIRKPKPVTPSAPVKPAQPVKPTQAPTINQSSNNPTAATPTPENKAPVTPKAPASVPKDDSIDMVIIEDGSATY